MRKLTKKEGVAVFVGVAVIAVFLVFGSLNEIPKLLGFNNASDISNEEVVNNNQPKVMSDTLQINDAVVGTGAEAKNGNTVTVNYRGALTNGKQFDSSYDRGEPFTFKLGAGMVIQGWEQGIAGMKVGGKRQLLIPASLAYGEQAVGPIPANSTLIFEVELLNVK